MDSLQPYGVIPTLNKTFGDKTVLFSNKSSQKNLNSSSTKARSLIDEYEVKTLSKVNRSLEARSILDLKKKKSNISVAMSQIISVKRQKQ